MLESILEYQKIDGKLVKIEKEITESNAKKVVNKMVGIVREAQQKIVGIEKNSNNLLEAFEKLQKSFEEQEKLASKFLKLKLETEKEETLQDVEAKLKQTTTNLLIIEKTIAKLSKNISETLKQFELQKNEVLSAKKKHAQGMSVYNSLVESKKEEIEKLKQDLQKLEKKIDPKFLTKYKKMRDDKIFPVFVPMINNTCSGCSMGLPVKQLHKLDEEKMLECENCHRIIYK